MTETKYDATVLQQYANDLYSQASWVIYSTAFIYGLITFGVTFLISSGADLFKHPNAGLSIQPGVLMIAAIGVAVGVVCGRKRRSSSNWRLRRFFVSAKSNSIHVSLRKPEAVSAAAGR